MSLREILIPEDKKFFELFAIEARNIQLASEKLLAAFRTEELPIIQARKEIPYQNFRRVERIDGIKRTHWPKV